MVILRRLRWVLLLLPLLVPLITSNEYIVHSVLVKACVYAIVVAGLDLVVGYNGDVSVGHAGLFAVRDVWRADTRRAAQGEPRQRDGDVQVAHRHRGADHGAPRAC